MYAHGLQPYTSNQLAFVDRLAVHDPVFNAVELFAELLGHAGDGIGELVDQGIEERDGGGGALAGFDGAARGLYRMQRRAPHAYEDPFGHDETQPRDGVGGLRDFLLQVW